MKILFKSITVLLLVIPIGLSAADGRLKGKYTKEKIIKKEFNVNADALLKVNNSYGNLHISSWNENKVLIEVHIKTNGNNEEKVQKKLDEITIDFEANTNEVSAKTLFHNNKSDWSWNWGKSNNVNMQVNYTIKLPIKNSVDLNNDYGGINLDRIDGHAKISCDYGRLEIGELHGRNNNLNFDYTTESHIGYIKSGEIRADYSGFTIDKAGNLRINADYTSTTVTEMENLQYICDYGNIEIKKANNIQGTGDYISVKLGKVYGNIEIKADYGNLKIEEMTESAGNLAISSDYTGVKIGYHPKYFFDFEIRTSYAGVSGTENFEIHTSTEKSNEKYYKGFYGKANSGNVLTIDSDYGGISLHKN
ncbi:hypothetical protein [uncultured Kriegella sp.]|uniref:hypothetical protein n=1 Tax=uncultured Kriegella sp. TaxID=1798910 RepID=UPI0030DA763C|tara:strand:- start:111437 stop:112525 length:1089 start_codon:yes stop_codon:yes gene_type:complete